MNIDPATKVVHETVAKLLAIANQTEPALFKSFLFGGIIGNVVGQLPEDYWREFLKSEPCGAPICNCHLMSAQVTKAMEMLRLDWQEHAPKPGFSE